MPADGLDPSTSACNSPTTTAFGYTHMTSQLPSLSSLELGPSWSWGGANVQTNPPPGPRPGPRARGGHAPKAQSLSPHLLYSPGHFPRTTPLLQIFSVYWIYDVLGLSCTSSPRGTVPLWRPSLLKLTDHPTGSDLTAEV